MNWMSISNWNDWRVLGKLSEGEGGDGGKRLCERNHYREVFHTPENPKEQDLDLFDEICDALERFSPR